MKAEFAATEITAPQRQALQISGAVLMNMRWRRQMDYELTLMLRELRDNKGYLSISKTWDAFCEDHLGSSRQTVNRQLEKVDLGQPFFQLLEFSRITPDEYKALDVADGCIVWNDQRITIDKRNEVEIRKVISDLREQHRRAEGRVAELKVERGEYKKARDEARTQAEQLEKDLEAAKNPPSLTGDKDWDAMCEAEALFARELAGIQLLIDKDLSQKNADRLGMLLSSIYYELTQVRYRHGRKYGVGENLATDAEVMFVEDETKGRRGSVRPIRTK
jgi:hypothetical protein